VGHVAWRDEKCIQDFLSESLKERDHFENLGIHEKIILDWILGKSGEKMWTECILLRIGTSGRLL